MKNVLFNKKQDNLSKKALIVNKPLNSIELTFEDYEDSDGRWLEKAKKLQARRWRKIKHHMA